MNMKSQISKLFDRGFDFYAPQSFEDESGRRILIGWMGIPDADYTNPTEEAGWQHALTIPRELSVRDGKTDSGTNRRIKNNFEARTKQFVHFVMDKRLSCKMQSMKLL